MDFIAAHPAQIAVTTLLVVYSLAKNKLTLDGIAAAVVTAGVHMLHPWGVFFWLLVVFFGAGTVATKVHHQQKALLTQSSTGGSGGESTGGRNFAQVLANSLPASIFILLHLYYQGPGREWLPVGIVASYAAAASDTLSSELGILSSTPPFLITQPWRRVPRGTNGGVTIAGLLWGVFGGFIIAVTAVALLPFPSSSLTSKSSSSSSDLSTFSVLSKFQTLLLVSFAGLVGTVLDSLLGALAQATIEDKSTGKIVEGANGRRAIFGKAGDGTRVMMAGTRDLLNNNGVNFAMAAGTGVFAMAVGTFLV